MLWLCPALEWALLFSVLVWVLTYMAWSLQVPPGGPNRYYYGQREGKIGRRCSKESSLSFSFVCIWVVV